MDITERKITKIAREAEKLVLLTMREEGVGTAEIDLIHALRHHPGCTQAQLAELLHADKAAIARRTKNLEGKGYLTREDAPNDRRSQLLFPTEKAESLKSSKADSRRHRKCAGSADEGRSRRLCRFAEQALYGVQDREPCGLPALPKCRRGVRRPMKNEKTFRPDRIFSYFRVEWLPLAFVTLSGLIYNIGLLATPWFEGRLAQCLADILSGSETAAQMALLVLAYILVALLVQASRFIKRFYVRRFANNINRRMKGIVNKSSCTLRGLL